VGETGPVISAEARTRGRLLFDAAINGTLGQVPLGPANDPSSAAQTYPSTPGGGATHRPRLRLAGDRVINVGVGTMQTALDVVAATEAPVVSQVAGAASALIYVWQRDWVGAGLAVAGMAPIIGAGADATRLGVRAADAAESAAVRAARIGREGEAAAGITGPKVGVEINGRLRFPDELSPTSLKEVKNVERQSWTKQLKDYSDLARDRKVPFVLIVRENTILSGPLRAARDRGEVIIRPELPRR
jgi:hypothetical protein